MEYQNIQLKEASVVLTKLEDKSIFQDSEVLSTENSDKPCDGSRKRKRKSTVPQRKIKRTDFYEDTDDNYSSTKRSNQTSPYDDENGGDHNEFCFPYDYQMNNNTNDDYNISANDVKVCHDEKQDKDQLKSSKTPIFVKKTKQSSDNKDIHESTNESSSIPSNMVTCSASNQAENENVVSIQKESSDRKVPNILSRTNRTRTKSVSLKSKQMPPVEIRPTTDLSNLKSTARTAFKETLNKQTTSPQKIAIPKVTEYRQSDNSELYKSPKSDYVKDNATCPSSITSPSGCLSSDNYLQDTKAVTNMSPSSSLTINQYAPSCEMSKEIKPSTSRPHYSSRLRSKSGTKFIVRKDSIITANLSDIFECRTGQQLPEDKGGKLVVKLPEQCLNGKEFYNNFVKKSNSSPVDNVAYDGIAESSGVKPQTRNESPNQNCFVNKSTPILKLTHNNSQNKEPFILCTNRGLDSWNTPDVHIMPESLQAISAEIKTSNQAAPKYVSIKERYLEYLKEKSLCDKDKYKSVSESLTKALEENKSFQMLSEQKSCLEQKKLRLRQGCGEGSKTGKNALLQIKTEVDDNTKLDAISNNNLQSKSLEIHQHLPLNHSLQDGRFVKTSTRNINNDSMNELYKVDQIKQEPFDTFNPAICKNQPKTLSHINEMILDSNDKKLNDHAYTLPENFSSKSTQKILCGPQNLPTVLQELSTSERTTGEQCTTPSQKQTSIPVFAVRCGEKVVLFPASNAVNLEKATTMNVTTSNSSLKTQKKITPSKNVKKFPEKIILPKRPDKQQADFAKKCGLNCAIQPKPKKPELMLNDLITTDFRTVRNKRPRNQMKHMCAVVVQITRSENNIFTFSKDVMALSFTNGSNPALVRWHNDGIHLTMVTFNNKSKIQHLSVDFISPGFYTLNLKNDRNIRRSRTFDGLLTSTLPNEDILHSEKDFLAIGQIKTIMDPTISKSEIRNGPNMTLTEALSDVLPATLAHVYNHCDSDRSYRPKFDDKNWYSRDNFETFTQMYARTRAFQSNGYRLPGEEVG